MEAAALFSRSILAAACIISFLVTVTTLSEVIPNLDPAFQ